MNLQKKMILTFILIAIIPTLFLAIFSYQQYTSLSKKQINNFTTNMMDRLILNIDETIMNIDTITETIQLYSKDSYTLMDDLVKYSTPESNYSSYDLYTSRNNMRDIFKNLLYRNNNINLVALFTPSGETISYSYSSKDIYDGYIPFEDAWYKQTLEQKGKLFISDKEEKSFIVNASDSISFSRAIYNFYTGKLLAVLYLDFKPELFSSIVKNDLNSISSISVTKNNGSLLYENSTPKDLNEKTNSLFHKTVSKTSTNYPLTVIGDIYYQDYYLLLKKTITSMLVILLISFIIIVCLSIFLSKKTVSPIISIAKIMRRNSENNHYIMPDSLYTERPDEIGVLYKEYNNLIITLNEFIQVQYENEIVLLESQMKFFKNQINSHFLYNTLESINSLAEIEGNDRISTITLSLADMFKYASKGSIELVPLEEELNNIKDYLNIQLIRFQNSFHYTSLVEDPFKKIPVLKLILQPIVENSLYHGLNRGKLHGDILITTNVIGKNLFIKVEDNGKGINESILTDLRKKLKDPFLSIKEAQEHVGLINIQTRIHLLYGKEYGLHLTSTLGAGTKVVIKLPI